MRVGGQTASDRDAAVVDEGTAVALGAEPGVLELGDHADGEVVGDPGDVDVVARTPAARNALSAATRPENDVRLGRRVRVEVAVTLAPPEEHDGRMEPGRRRTGSAR